MPAGGDQAPLLLRLDQGVHGGGKERLSRDTVRDATRLEIQELKRESDELKQLVAELSLQVHRLKKTAIPMPRDGARING